MKKLITRITGIVALAMLFVAAAPRAQAQDVTVSFQTFYDNLSPYGQWVYDPDYGNVWVPNEGGDFRPYGSRGYWVMTEYGNTWLSDDPWGWACYHYGRWTYNPYYGWIWVPGYEWAPAWVSWRYGGGYSGWAPLGPGVSISLGYNCPDNWWVFVEPRYMYQNNWHNHWRGPSYNTTYIHQTTIINNYYVDNSTHVRYNYGPRGEVIQRDTHTPVQVYRVNQVNRPGAPSVTRNTVSLYRPAVNRQTVTQARPTNVVQAPRAIGRPQAAANNMSGNRAPAFRQEAPRLQQATPRAMDERQVQRNEPGRLSPADRQQPNQQPRQEQPRPQQPRQGQPGVEPRQQPRQEQPRPQQPMPQPRQEQPRPQQPMPQPRQEQPRPQQAMPQPRQEQPRPQQPMPQPRQEQPRPQQPMPQPRQEQPRPQQPMPQPRQEQPRPQQPMPQPRQEQPRPQQPMPQPRQEQPRPEQHQPGRR